MIVLFIKARDKRDTLTPDLFGDGQMALFVKPTPIKSYTDKNGRVVPAHTANIKHSTDQKDVATSSKMLYSEAVETKQQERKMETINVVSREAGGKLLTVTVDSDGRGIVVRHGGNVLSINAQFGAARGLPKEFAGKYSHMLVAGQSTIPLTPEEASIITAARESHARALAEKDTAFAATPRGQRQKLVEAEYNSYSPESFPGSAAWKKNKQAADALTKFDAAHPELVAEIEADRAAKQKADYDALSDFVKMGS